MSTEVQISNSTVGLWCLQVCFAAVPALGPSFASLRNSKETQRNSKELKAARKWMKYHSSTQICRCTAIFQLMALRELVGGGAAPPQVGSWMPPALVSGRTRTRQNQFYDGLCFVVILLYGSWPCLSAQVLHR